MEDKFIRNRILTIDQEARDRVKNLVNEYAANSKGHPFGNYGDSITLEKYELCPIYVVELHTQFDRRPINPKRYPYKGGSFGSRSIYRASDIDAWSYSLLTTTKFVHNGESFEVTGSHHVESCDPCGGKGRITCPNCGGRGDITCSSCGGSGSIRCSSCGGKGSTSCSSCGGSGKKTESYSERYVSGYDGYTPIYSTRLAYKTVSCSSCGGSGKHTCSSCGGSGSKRCSNCGGSGRLTCGQCNGRGDITCSTCQGYGKNVHCFSIDQELKDELLKAYFHDEKVAGVAEIMDKRGGYKGEWMFEFQAPAVGKGVFSGESEMAAKLDSMIEQHARKVSDTCHILFQNADILRCEAWWVEYTYKGKRYNGVIYRDQFMAGVSPITEYADKILKEADKKLGGLGTIKARKLLDQAEDLNVYGSGAKINSLKDLVTKHLNTLYNLGTDLTFWLIALFVTPFLYNFYSDLNPVAKYVFFTNDPTWPPYAWLPALQCILFLVLLWIAKMLLNYSDHSKAKFKTVFGFVLSGIGIYLLIAAGILAVLLAANYFGLSVVTSWAGYLAWLVVRFLLIATVMIIFTILAIAKWLWKAVLWIWHLIF